jgi:hypothetical protein
MPASLLITRYTAFTRFTDRAMTAKTTRDLINKWAAWWEKNKETNEDFHQSVESGFDATPPSRSTGIVQQKFVTTIVTARTKRTYTDDLQTSRKPPPTNTLTISSYGTLHIKSNFVHTRAHKIVPVYRGFHTGFSFLHVRSGRCNI